MSGETSVQVSQHRFVLDREALDDLANRLTRTRLPTDLGTGWERGVPRSWLENLLEDWRGFDPDTLQHQLDGLHQFRAEVDGHAIHLVVAEGRGPDPVPLLLTHGWPGSFLEYLKLLPLLSDPSAHGADASDAFTVIVPSLPGYGFSGPPPPTGFTGRQVAALWHALMSSGLGHECYVAHGSDLGAGVTGWLARDYPEAVRAIHLATPGLAPAADRRTAEEQEYASAVSDWTREEGAYAHEHATKPATVAAALSDSPAGMAAWIAEKIVAWSSTRSDGSPAFDRELLLSTLTLYWATGTITTSLVPYWAYGHNVMAALPLDDPPPVPTAVTIFGGERVPFPKPPRELGRRYYMLKSWTEQSLGGHFPAVAEPALLTQALRDAFCSVRKHELLHSDDSERAASREEERSPRDGSVRQPT
jgi:pimeloyl-ACP methyl ester carboxylesterase